MSETMNSGDRVGVFSRSHLLLAGIVGPLLMPPESSSAMMSAVFSFTNGTFGWLYLAAGLAFNCDGNVRLGGANEPPE